MRDIQDYTSKYVEEPFESTMVEIRKKTVLEQCRKYVHDHILEVGCGMNPLFMDMDDFKQMVIVEPSALFVQNANNLLEGKKFKEKIVIKNGFLEDMVDNLKNLAVTFDVIIVSSLLHEVDEPQKLLSAIKEVCDDNTVVHINVPNANSIHRLIAIEAGLISNIYEQSAQQILMQRRRTYDICMLKEEIAEAGFQVVDQGSYFIKPFTHEQMQKCIDNKIIDERVLIGLEKLVKYFPEYGSGIYVNIKKKG